MWKFRIILEPCGITLRLTLTSHLIMDKHISKVWSAQLVFIGSSNCDVCGDHWIQSQRRRWSMPSTLVHGFDTSHIDYCNVQLAATTDKLQRLLSAPACLVSDTRKFNQGSWCMSTFIGLTCRYESSSSLCRWCITALITRLPGTWQAEATAFESLMWPVC